MDFRVFSRNISENMHARCVREDTKQALKGNLQADGVQSRQTFFVQYCRKSSHAPVEVCGCFFVCGFSTLGGGGVFMWNLLFDVRGFTEESLSHLR